MPGSDSANFGYGRQEPTTASDDFNSTAFLVSQMMAQLDIMKLVVVKEVHAGEAGGDGPPIAGTVDVQPLVNQIDGNRNATPHGTVFGIPWFRLQGGSGAVVCDPVAGDIGYVSVADRDISIVKSTKAVGNPGSSRTYNIADGVYVGSLLAAAPTQYLWFKDDGITVKTPQLNVEGPTHVTENIVSDGNISTPTGNVSAPAGTVSGENVAASAGLSGASISIPGSAVASASNPMVTGAATVNLSGGFTWTEVDLGTPTNGSTLTPSPLNSLKQKLTNNVAGFTIAASGLIGDIELRIVNGSAAGTITFTGFVPWAGDSLDTVNGHKFIVFLYGFGGSDASYVIKAMQ